MDAESVVEGYRCIFMRMANDGQVDVAIRLANAALKVAEKSTGQTSAITGRVLLDLLDLYDISGQEEEAAIVWCQIAQVLKELQPACSQMDGPRIE